MQLDTIYRGDCVDVLSETFTSLHQVFADMGVGLPKQFADLIYMDPPFFSNREYEKPWKDTKIGFTDNEWGYSLAGLKGKYLPYMKDRIQKCYNVLKSTGSFYIQCDWHAGHYLKQICDDVFGYNNFISEIMWRRKYQSATITSNTRSFGNNHDVILFYSKSPNYIFNRLTVDLEVSTINYMNDENGYFKTSPAGNYCEKTLNKMIENGIAYKTRNGKIRKKTYLKFIKNKLVDTRVIDNIWMDIPNMMHVPKKEKQGWPTQKPEALLERIIKASSNPGEIVLDPFCGCGTTSAVAYKLDRHFIGIDLSMDACDIIKKRLNKLGAKTEVLNCVFTVDELKKMPAFNFQDYIIEICLRGMSKIKKTGDMGIDGYNKDGIPIQVKQCKIQRTDIENFESALDRYYTQLGNENKIKKGLIIGEGLPPDSVFAEIKRIKEKRDTIIEFIGIQECCNILNSRWTYMGRQEGWNEQKHLEIK